LKIGILTTYLALGDETDSGIGQHYRILADALVAAGHQVHVVCATLDSAQLSVALAKLAPGWTYDMVPMRPPSWLAKLFPSTWTCQILLRHLWYAWVADRVLSRACDRLKLEIVETHAYNAPALCFLYRRHRPTLLTRVSTTLGQILSLSTLRSRSLLCEAALERHVIRCSDALVTHTRQHRDTLCALEDYSAQRFALVAHGIPDPGALPPVLETGVEFLYVGRFEPRKGIDVLLAAIPLVAAAVPHAKFTLVGDHGDGEEWDAFTIKHPELINSRVHAPGRVSAEALAEYYRRCLVFVAPSRYESFGLIYAEAMSHAKPVIGCTVGGVPEVVTEGVTGLLTAPGDVDELAACMTRLATDAPLRQRMGQAARDDFLNRFSAAKMAEASVQLYRELSSITVI